MNATNPYRDRIEWILCDPVEKENVWYLDHQFVRKTQDSDMYGGASGFVVDKQSGKVADISWSEYHRIR